MLVSPALAMTTFPLIETKWRTSDLNKFELFQAGRNIICITHFHFKSLEVPVEV